MKAADKARGQEAAVAYLRRIGWDVLTDEPGQPLLAVDRDTNENVLVVVTTHDRAVGPKVQTVPKDIQEQATALLARVDFVTVRVIAPDRALLRHHRRAYVEGPVTIAEIPGGEQ